MFEHFVSPDTTVVRSGKYGPYQQQRRDVTSTWVLNPEAEGVPSVCVTLTTSHWGERKEFASRLTWETRRPAEPGSPFSITTWGSDHTSLGVHTVRVQRYAKSKMEQHHTEALAAMEDHWLGARRVFAEAIERNGLDITTSQITVGPRV